MRKTQSPVFLGQQPSAVHGRMVGLGDGVQVFLPGPPGGHIQIIQLQDAVLDGVGQLKVYDAPRAHQHNLDSFIPMVFQVLYHPDRITVQQ